MKKRISVLLVCLALMLMGCGTFVFLGPEEIGLPETRPEGAAQYCLFISSLVLEESRGAIAGTGFAGRLAEENLNLYSHNIHWVLDFSSDDFTDIKKMLVKTGFDSPIISKPEQLPFFKGSDDGTKACYVKKY